MSQTSIINQELIGLNARIAQSSDPSLVRRAGCVIDESKEMFTLLDRQKEFTVTKANCVFDFELQSGETIRIDGRLLRGKSEDRIKKRLNGRW
jgi:ribonuclease P protein subunit POP4